MTRVLAWIVASTAMAMVTMGDARAEVIEHLTVRGHSALVSFDELTPHTCADGTEGTLETFVSISGFANVTRSLQMPDTDTNTVVAVASRSDSCTGNFVVGSATLDNAFRQTALQSATIRRTFRLADVSGNPVMTLVVNLTLEGTGPTNHTFFHDRFVIDGPDGPIVTFEHSVGRNRDVTVAGSVKLDGDEVIDTFTTGALQEIRSGTVEIQR